MLMTGGSRTQGFFFPRRQRFNEDTQDEISSQRNGLNQKMSGLTGQTPISLKNKTRLDQLNIKDNLSRPGS